MKREDLYVRSIVLNDFIAYVTKAGGDPRKIARDAHLDLSPRNDKLAFVSWSGVCNFLEIAAKELDDPYLGLKSAMALSDDFRTTGPNVIIAMTVKDMREFADIGIKYQRIHTNGVSYSYHEDLENNEVVSQIKFHPFSPPCRQYAEHIVATIAQMGRRPLDDFPMKKVRFQHRSLGDDSWYKKAIGCPVEFNADTTEIIFDSKIFDIDLGGKRAIGRPLLKMYLNHHLNKKSRKAETVEVMVSRILPGLLGLHQSSVNSVAQMLDLSTKKLQRLLADEGTSYSQILDKTRQSIAARLLRDSDISISRMAGMLDYKSTEAFIAAAKRWFGTTPSKYRSASR